MPGTLKKEVLGSTSQTMGMIKGADKDLDLAKSLNKDQVNALIYLRDNLKRDMTQLDAGEILVTYIPTIIKLKQQGISPSWEQIEEGIRLGKEITIDQINASLAAQVKFKKKLSLDHLKAWIDLKDREGINSIDPGIILDNYIPVVVNFQSLIMKNILNAMPSLKQIEEVVTLNNSLRKHLNPDELHAWMLLKQKFKSEMVLITDSSMQYEHIKSLLKLIQSGRKSPSWDEINGISWDEIKGNISRKPTPGLRPMPVTRGRGSATLPPTVLLGRWSATVPPMGRNAGEREGK
jgi:hypothetical protein